TAGNEAVFILIDNLSRVVVSPMAKLPRARATASSNAKPHKMIFYEELHRHSIVARVQNRAFKYGLRAGRSRLNDIQIGILSRRGRVGMRELHRGKETAPEQHRPGEKTYPYFQANGLAERAHPRRASRRCCGRRSRRLNRSARRN